MNTDKQKNFIIHCLFIFIVAVMVYVGIKYLLPMLMPFVIGLITAIVFQSTINFIQSKTKLNRTLVSVVVLLVFYSFVCVILMMIGAKAVEMIGNLFYRLPQLYKDTLLPAMQVLTESLTDQFPRLQIYLYDFLSNIDQTIFSLLSGISTRVVGMAAGIAGSLPNLLINFIFMIVCSFFFTIDYNKITAFLMKQFHERQKDTVIYLKDNIFSSLGKFIRGYAAIILITFSELAIGFRIVGVPNPMVWALIVAIIDIMPILGTGLVLLPWALAAFVMGHTVTGIKVMALYLFITVVRQIIEPRIIGQQIGLHPVVTLVLMFVGAQLMGVGGLFLLPITAAILVKLNNDGNIHIFNT